MTKWKKKLMQYVHSYIYHKSVQLVNIIKQKKSVIRYFIMNLCITMSISTPKLLRIVMREKGISDRYESMDRQRNTIRLFKEKKIYIVAKNISCACIHLNVVIIRENMLLQTFQISFVMRMK